MHVCRVHPLCDEASDETHPNMVNLVRLSIKSWRAHRRSEDETGKSAQVWLRGSRKVGGTSCAKVLVQEPFRLRGQRGCSGPGVRPALPQDPLDVTWSFAPLVVSVLDATQRICFVEESPTNLEVRGKGGP